MARVRTGALLVALALACAARRPAGAASAGDGAPPLQLAEARALLDRAVERHPAMRLSAARALEQGEVCAAERDAERAAAKARTKGPSVRTCPLTSTTASLPPSALVASSRQRPGRRMATRASD